MLIQTMAAQKHLIKKYANRKLYEGDGGDTLHDRGQALFDYVRRTLSGPAAMVSSRVERGRSELEELVDVAVERALTRLSIPTRRDLEALNARLDELEARIASLGTPARPARAR